MGAMIATMNPAAAAEDTKIRVFLFDYAEVSRTVLDNAKAAASAAMEPAGVEIEWAECATPGKEAPKDSLCDGHTTMDIQLRILNAAMASRMKTSRHCLGYAITTSGSVASVYHHRAVELANLGFAPLGVILGAAMAHEIGHLLLAEPGHSSAGLMRANWDKAEMESMGRGRLTFSKPQASRVRSMAEKRAGERPRDAAVSADLALAQ